MGTANEHQAGGSHYRPASGAYQHWDFVHDAQIDWCGANATKYVGRWRKKGTPELDLQKAIHYLTKRHEQITSQPFMTQLYYTSPALEALFKWIDANDDIPEVERDILELIIMGENDKAIGMIKELLVNK